MSICRYCGEEITFRYVDDRLTPIHENGGCTGYVSGRSGSGHHFSALTYESYTRPTRCPHCGRPVFFYKSPYGGMVYFDELGPPWPKHPCLASDNSVRQHKQYQHTHIPNYEWAVKGWTPIISPRVNPTPEGFLAFKGEKGDSGVIQCVYIEKQAFEWGGRPILTKPDDGPHKLSIATIQNATAQVLGKPLLVIAFDSVLSLKRHLRGNT